jgi:hypothetical protein
MSPEALLRNASRVCLTLGLLAAVAGSIQAAPALKDRPTDGSVDLSAVHKVIAEAKPGTEFPVADRNKVEHALSLLLARLDSVEKLPAGMSKGRKLLTFDQLRKPEVVETVKIIQKEKELAVGKEGRMSQSTFSVLLVSGDAELVQSHNCIVVAGGNVKAIQSSNCIIVAGGSVEMTQCIPRAKAPKDAGGGDASSEPVGSVVVAGERLKCVQSKVGIAIVLRPKITDSGKPIQSIQCRDILFCNAPDDWKSGTDTDCRAEPLKSPIAK